MQDPERNHFMELVKTARDYCRLIDRIPARKDWLSPLFQLLPRLHANVVSLRDPGGDDIGTEQLDLDDPFQKLIGHSPAMQSQDLGRLRGRA